MKYLKFTSNPGLILAGLLMFIQISCIFGQEPGKSDNTVNSFVLIRQTDETRTELELDLNQLPGFFERAYLLELIFQDPTVVVVETNLSLDRLPLVAVSGKELEAVVAVLETFKNKAVEAGRVLPPAKKEEMMKKYEKFR